MTRTRRKMNPNTTIPFAILIFLLSAVLTAVILIVLAKGDRSSNPHDSQQSQSDDLGKWQEGIIDYKGKRYQYNQAISAYLFMGIDQEGPVEKAPDMQGGGQSDAIFLLIANADDKTLSVLSIHRNAMVKVETCDKDGNDAGTTVTQICLQHAYGDGMHLSCKRSVKAVSRLLYSQPIKGYLTMNMGGMPKMNDAIGGIELEVIQDLHYPGAGVDLKKGQVVTLSGTEAYYYLRGRDTNEFDSATDRLRRQEQYISCYIEKLKKCGLSQTIAIHDAVAEYMVTDMDFLSMVSDLAEYEYDADRMYSVPGETVMGYKYEEFYVDDEALYDLVIHLFYEEVEES